MYKTRSSLALPLRLPQTQDLLKWYITVKNLNRGSEAAVTASAYQYIYQVPC